MRTSSCELSVFYLAALRLRLILRLVNPLDAEGALLHDTTLTYSNVWIELVVQGKNKLSIDFVGMEGLGVIIPPVEGTNLVGTIVRAITCAHTTVIDLQVKLFCIAMRRSKDRADRFTGCMTALLAKHRLKTTIHFHFRIGASQKRSIRIQCCVRP